MTDIIPAPTTPKPPAHKARVKLRRVDRDHSKPLEVLRAVVEESDFAANR
jgi:hypothetical protein